MSKTLTVTQEEKSRTRISQALFLLVKRPEESLSPTLDVCILIPLRMHYFFWKSLLTLAAGKEKRNQSKFLESIRQSIRIVPSHLVAGFANSIIRKLPRLHQFTLVKIIVPKYGYRYYCRLADFSPGREDDIMHHFDPPDGGVVIDVGAHVGRYTLLSSKLVGLHGKVIAIEAHPENYQMLKKNLALNKLTNVTPFNFAAYSEDGHSLPLFLAGEKQGNTIYNTVMEQRTNTEEFVAIPAIKLDSLIQQISIAEDQISWIKIDVEGAEYEVLKGAQNILEKSKDLSILVEVHNLREGNFFQQIIVLLEKYRFDLIHEKKYDNGERHIILRKRV